MTGSRTSTWSMLPRGTRLVLRLLLAVGLLVGIAGCSGADNDSADSGATEGGAFAPAADLPGDTSAEDAGEVATDEGAAAAGSTESTSVTSVSEAQLLSDRKRILRADLVVQSDSVLTDARLAEAAATAAGGVVTDEQTATDLGAPDATTPARTVSVLTMRVPPAALDELLLQLGELGTVLSQNRGSDDVTDEYVDVAARVDSQRASLDRLLALVTDAADLTDIVTLENEISRRQSDLDALSARLQTLDEEVALATVTLTLTSPEDETAAASSTGFVAGLGNGWDAFTSALVGALTVLGAVLPFAVTLAVIGIPLYLLRVRRRSTMAVATTTEPPAA